MNLEDVPAICTENNEVTWRSKAFLAISENQQAVALSQINLISINLVTEVLLAEGPFQSVVVVPLSASHRLMVFFKRESSAGLPSSSIELLALLVHDLRSPITSIYGFAETIIESRAAFSPEDIMVFLRKIRGAAMRANVLLTNMQALASGVKAGSKTRRFQVNSLVKEVLDGMWLEPGAKLKVEFESADTEVDLDYLAAERIIGNLVNNAAKFCSKDGEIKVRTSLMTGGVQVTIFNSGSQILPDELPLIFEKFQRASSSKGKPGTGLGLFIVKHLADQIGAVVTVESGIAGTLFSVFFPSTKLRVL